MKILKNKKLLLGLLLILVIEIGWAIHYLAQNTKYQILNTRYKAPETKKPVSFSLEPSFAKFSVGEEFQVSLILSTAGKPVVGADVIIEYDPEKIEVLEILPGQIFNFYPNLKVGKEKILVSAINQQEKEFTGQGILGQLNLKGKAKGETKLTFEFEPNQTTDSNVALKNSHQDGLEKVKNGVYTFIK